MNLEFAEGRMQTSTLNGAVTTYVCGAAGKYLGGVATKAIFTTPGAQQATMSTASPSAYDIVPTILGHRAMGGIQKVTNVVGAASGSVITDQAANTLIPALQRFEQQNNEHHRTRGGGDQMTHPHRTSHNPKRGSRIALAAFMLLTACFPCATGGLLKADQTSGQHKKNTISSRCANQERDTERVDTWRGLYIYYTRYKHCGFNADVAEGISEVIAKLLVKKWAELTTVGRELRLERPFTRYVLAGVNSTLDHSDLNSIIQMSRDGCGIGLERFCKSLNARAKQAVAEIK